jgi:RHS repeat-associated protein
LIDAKGQRTSWERDVHGPITRELRADNTTDTLYTYDLSGRLKTITDPKDQVTTHSYNVDDSLSGTAYTNEVIETPNVSYTYDAYYARVATMVDGIGTTTYAYKAAATNDAGQVASVDGPLTNDTIAYSYDELGRVTQRTINGTANQVDWTFDALGRVTSEENLLGEFTYTYDGVTNRLLTVTYPNSQTSTYGYSNNAGDRRLQTIHHKYPNASTLSKFDYTYDAAGNIVTWRQQADTTAVLWEYGYDQADQLTSAVKKSTATPATILQRFAYAYDPVGNRTVEQIDDAVTLSAYNNLNRLTAQVPGGPMVIIGALNEPGTVTISGTPAIVDANNNFRGTVPTTIGTNAFTIVARDATGNATTEQYEIDVAGSGETFSYDANGNMISDATRTLNWNARNQLVHAAWAGSSLEYVRDGVGRAITAKSFLGSILQSAEDLLWCDLAVCERREQGTSNSTKFLNFGFASVNNDTFLTRDHQASVSAKSNSSGVVLQRSDYDPYGRQLSNNAGLGEDGYALQQVESAVGLSAAVFRQYDARLGRWISEDPLGMVDGPNLYAYAIDNPIRFVDSLGLSCQEVAAYPVTPWLLQSRNESNISKKLIATEISGMEEGFNIPGGARIGIPFGIVSCVYRKSFTVTFDYARTLMIIEACETCEGSFLNVRYKQERNRRKENRNEITKTSSFFGPWTAEVLAAARCEGK